jgi:hypothetical protein
MAVYGLFPNQLSSHLFLAFSLARGPIDVIEMES